MPRMDDESNKNESDSLCKLLLIGDGKVGKTYYAGMAAAAGLNVFYLDGDVGRPTLKTLPAVARSRIWAIDCADTLIGGKRDSRFCDTIISLITDKVFRWNDSKSAVATRGNTDVGDDIWSIRPAYMDHTCVLVLDSWTGLCESIMTKAAGANSVDLMNATTPEMRPVYQAGGIKSIQILTAIRSLRCHVIVLAHPDEYTHMIKPVGKVKDAKETEQVIDWTKLIPKSTSKPNSLQMGKYFTDIGWAVFSPSGLQREIDFRPKDSILCGGHFSEKKSQDEYSFASLVKHLGGSINPAGAPTEHWLTTETQTEEANTPPPAQVLSGMAQTQIKSSGLASLLKKPAVAG